MKSLKLMTFCLAIIAIGLSSCKKKEVVGPTGPAGPAGNANVQSLTFVTASGDWVGNGVDGYEALFNAPIITADIMGTGAVLCYLTTGGTTYALPYSYLNGTWTRHMLFTFSEGALIVRRIDDDGLTTDPTGSTVKIVTIASSGLIAHPDLDLTNYDAVAAAFDLK